ncbi:MAG: hypothetical protein EXR07_12225 [Acetobacteraceae bacterium]|nr:hypothetical protein [Acetobacteraceae bacterium]
MAQPAPQPTATKLSFMGMVKKTGTLPKNAGGKKVDPLTLAKTKIVEALKLQKGYVTLVAEDKPLPKNQASREASTWFCRQLDGWWTTVRYGQISIPMTDKGETAMLIGDKLEDVAAFYDAVITAITKGELDTQIGKLQADRSAALRGTH